MGLAHQSLTFRTASCTFRQVKANFGFFHEMLEQWLENTSEPVEKKREGKKNKPEKMV
ncbi:MAG: hypothetical protein LBI70_03555 [Rickettsiales bacterium]|jgi:hypothetical protein|nr:hypothetical protein [Rickettsiales bacterium]